MEHEVVALLAGFLLAAVAAPVGVSGAVFLLPVQLSVLSVPNPQVTPTNLLYNVVAGPGAITRYRRQRQLDTALTWALVLGSVPGVVLGAVLRVFVADDPTVFRLIAASVLLPTGLVVLCGSGRLFGASEDPGGRAGAVPRRVGPTIGAGAFVIGMVGGIYGIGGGSILGPLLVGAGFAVTRVAPAALASTWVTSITGVLTYAVLALHTPGTIAPDWGLGIAAGVGGLAGGYVGARLQPRLPERALRALLGLLAFAVGVLYVVQAVA
ncbi:putative membrane protein YfcA [Marmoricola sp. OAE513]|uniref:TSUP family transporter n=1 Tax=Marmoricola sp. OAE513 TaxID=2817894 RepID=UPI001AE8669B